MEKYLIGLLILSLLHGCFGVVQYFSVLEEQEPGTFVGNLTRRDNFKYYFLGQVDYFRIDPDNGMIFTKSRIDREALTSDDLKYVVVSSSPVYATEITVKVLDINDNAPKFNVPSVNIELLESVEVGTLIPLESATDPDLGPNSVTSYSIISGNAGGKFTMEIIFNILHLKVVNKLDRELNDSYTLNISASDNGTSQKFGYLRLNITVLDVNDNAPLFSPTTYRADIYENATVGTSLLQINATDQDYGSNGKITYSLKDTTIFSINSLTGLISLTAQLDFETTQSVVLSVQAADGGSTPLSSTATVSVTVKDVNDNSPVIKANGVTHRDLKENMFMSNFLFLEVTDKDFKPVNLQIVSGNIKNKFSIVKFAQNYFFLTMNAVLDREEQEKYLLIIQASDSGKPQLISDYHLVINVLDENDNKPVFEKESYYARITEGCPSGSYVADVKASDRDTGSNSVIRFAIAGGNYNNWFQISQTTGLITTTSDAIDYDILVNSSIILTVTATDQGSRPLNTSTSVSITIGSVNDNKPIFNQTVYSVTINESLPIDSVVLNVTAVDNDKGMEGRIHYKFDHASNLTTTTFTLNAVTGEISLQKKLDYSTAKLYSFYVLAVDNGSPQLLSRASVIISIKDMDNHLPVFSVPTFHANVVKSSLPGAIGTFRAVDTDSGMYGETVYTIEAPSCCNYFVVNQITGMVNSTRLLNVGEKFDLLITATSNGKTARAGISVVVVEDTSKNPLFNRNEYSFYVEENSSGKFVGKLELVDISKVVIYSIEGGNELGFFRINNKGELFAQSAIDRGKHASFTLTIIARTNQTLFLVAKAKAMVFVKDLNDNAPVLAKQELSGYSVREDALVGDYVFTVFATDADYGRNALLSFSIEQGPGWMPFEIDPTTGSVFVSKSLFNQSQSEYAINVKISDMGSPRQSTAVSFLITVIDTNDHSPQMSASHYDVIIPRNLSVNSRFLKLVATDADFGNNGKVLYEIQSGNTGNTFGIFPSGWIYLKVLSISASLDYFLLNVMAYDQGNPRKSSTTEVSIFVEQYEVRKIFRSSVFHASIAENQAPNTLVTDLSNNILSTSSNASLRFFKESTYFFIQQQSGMVRTKGMIDREAFSSSGNDTIVSIVVAEQNISGGSIKETCILIVTVSDVNDNAPVFERSVYTSSINEGSSVSTTIIKVQAFDKDSPATSKVVYEIRPAQSYFSIDSSSGVIQVASSSPALDYEANKVHNFTVVAVDNRNSSLFSSCQVFVYVKDLNDNRPSFTKAASTLSVSESATVGSSLFTFSASDIDSGNNGFVTYSLSSNDVQFPFKINKYSGELYLTSALDFETRTSYDITISATDHGVPPLHQTYPVRVSVLDFNDNTPKFDMQPSTLLATENIPPLSVIGKCSASDQDSGSNKIIRYTAIGQWPVKGMFKVDASNCEISTNAVLDREITSSYFLVIKAEDNTQNANERLSAIKNITILVEDINDNPPTFLPPFAAGFSRPFPAGNEIIKVSAVDPDAGQNGTVTYSISRKLDYASFAINANTGSVTVVGQLANSRKLFEIEVQATDQGSGEQKHSTAVFSFFVMGAVADNPACSGTGQASSHENIAIGTNVYRVQAVSTETSSQMTYFLKNGDAKNSFSLDSSTGWISTRRIIDYDSGVHRCSLTVYAVEKAGSVPKTNECSVTISILDVNDNAPEFTSISDVSVLENVKVGHEVYQVQATDKDAGSNGLVEYAIADGNLLSTFVIDAGTGMVKLAKLVDREVIPVYNLTIEASNKGSHKSYAQLIVKVSDVNDNVPTFNQTFYSFTIKENSPIYSTVGTVKATDADSGRNKQIYYEITDKDQNVFVIDQTTGVLRVSSILDYELVPNFMLNVKASDYGQPRLSSNVTVFINLLDTNDNCPIFSSSVYSSAFGENLATETFVTAVKATDKDSGQNGQVVYEIVSGNIKDSFSVSANGNVVTRRLLDREETPSFRLLLRASDRGETSERNCLSYAIVAITVLDVNDNAPTLNLPHIVHIPESSPVGAVVYTFSATDADYGVNSTVKFSFKEPTEIGSVFQLVENGSLVLTSRLDYETKKEYYANVSVSDHGNPPRLSVSKVTIMVLDVNDNNPIIGLHPEFISVIENATIGSSLIEFSATDLDSGNNARIHFSIISGNQGGVFNIEATSGILYVEKAMDREERRSYLLEIEAKDSGVPQRRGVTSLNVILIDVNDCAPKFSSPIYNVSVLENSYTGIILSLQASDCDIGMNAFLQYSLDKSLLSNTFAINPTTGVISVLQPLDRESHNVLRLTVTARDSGNPSLSGTTVVVVSVLDENDNSPIITPSNVTKSIRENLNGDVEIQRFQITDSDFGLNSTLDVSIVNEYGSFQLKSAGSIYTLSTTRRLDRELTDYYFLQIQANDRGAPMRTSVAYLHLFVGDDNDSPPVFSKKRYEIKTRSNAPIGTFVTQLTATDKDTVTNSNMQFRITSGNDSFVTIGTDTGIIVTKLLIPLHTIFEIGVEVSDPKKPQLKDTATVVVEATTGYPTFSHGELYSVVSESSPVGTYLNQVNATSNEIGPAAKINYFVNSGNTGLTFRIEQTSGKIYVNNPLDYETTRLYSLWIEARDSKNPPQSSYIKFVITVKNENDSAPIITGPKTNVLFSENQGSNALVTRVVAVDVDNPSTKLRLRFKLGLSAALLPFAIDPISGEIRTTKDLNREEISSYQLEVVVYAAEQPSLSSAYNLSILIEDLNDNRPVVHSPSQIQIPENFPVNSQVTILNVTDKDQGINALVTFYLISDTFHINVNTGRITLIRSLDRELQSSYSLSIQIRDASYQIIHHLTVSITDINDSPPYFPSIQLFVNVSEGTPVGNVFGQVAALDKDIGNNAACFYHIEPRSGLGYISIDPLSGSLSLKRKVKYVLTSSLQNSDPNTLQFILTARNIKSPFYTAKTKLLIQILDANDHAPTFSQSTYLAYVESVAAIGHIVTSVLASDTYDTGQNAVVRYSIVSGNGSSIFVVNGNSIKVNTDLSTFVNTVLQLVIQAADNGAPSMSSTAFVNIVVTEENRHSPVFSKPRFDITVPENKQLQKELVKVVALDQDSGDNGRLVYSIKSGNIDNVFSIGIISGSLFLIKPLDFEKTSSYRLVIEAKDSAKVSPRTSTVNVNVRVTDVNDNRPVFTSKIFSATVVENSPSNTQVTKVVATDADLSNIISYDIQDPTSRVYFTIDSSTGIIRTRTGIDYEMNQSFNIKVTASDNGSPVLTSMVDVNISVIGVNEYTPRFTSKFFTFEVSQHARVGTIVGNVSAIDNDNGIDGVVVYLPRFSITNSPFQLDTASGNVLVKSPLTVGKYILPIFVKNILKVNLAPSDIDQATMSIDVIKGNEPPIFSSASYVTSIQENSPSGQSVFTVSATDDDGTVLYRITNQLPSKAFSIDPSTGEITVGSHLNREVTPEYVLTVEATDRGSPPASNSTKIRITLTDANDNKPKIVNCNGSVMENATIGTLVTKIHMEDADIDPNRGPFTYQTNSKEFGVSGIGELTVAGPLDREKVAEYNVSIVVTDNGSPAQRSSGFCVIKIIDVSDVTAKRRNARVIFNNLGPNALGGLIGSLSPYDPDHSDSYTCAIKSAHNIFHFEPASCILHVASHRNIGFKTVNFTAKSLNTEVEDSVSIYFVPIINSTVNKTLVIQLKGFSKTVLDFTNNTILQLNQFLESISPRAVTIRVIGYKQQAPMTLDLLIAAFDKQSFITLSVEIVTSVLSSNTVQLRQIAGASSIALPFKACVSDNLCLNNGTCSEFRSLDSHSTLWNSMSLIFVGISFKATFACKCRPGFYGSRCEKIISSCTPNPCQNGGTCNERSSGELITSSCTCRAGYTGKYCEVDINECLNSPCSNGGFCINTKGDYYCQCGTKYTGKNCENVVNFCSPNPCLFGGTCVPNDASFTCSCKFGNQGKYCEINPMTFNALSYLSFNSFANQPLNVSMDFATYDKYSLLLYGFQRTISGTNSPFVGFELIDGGIRFSCNYGTAVKRLSIDSLHVADGYWHTASFYLSAKKLSIKIDKVTKELIQNEATQTPDLGGTPLYIAGVPTIDVILQRPNQLSVDDFTGCMRNIYINGYHVDRSTAAAAKEVVSGCTKAIGCSASTCRNGQCISSWKGFQCQCKSGFSGDTCAADAKPFTFGGKSYVMFKLVDSYRRKLQLAMSNTPVRRRRSVVSSLPTTNSFSIEFRTRNTSGLLLYAEDIGGNYTILHISNGGIRYKFVRGSRGSGSMAIEKPLVTDGKWHSISLIVSDNKVSLSVDKQATQTLLDVFPHKFYSTYTDTLSVAGTTTPKSVDGKQLVNFNGCLQKMSLNNENLEIKSSNKFNVTIVGSTQNDCDACVPNPCHDPVKSYCIGDWEAYRCIDPGQCKTQPCKNNGTCIPTGTGFSCNCNGNFTGSACETPLICLRSPCKEGENCVADELTTFKCVVVDKSKGLTTSEIVMIVVFTVLGLALIFAILFLWRRRHLVNTKKFEGDFLPGGQEIEMKHSSKPTRFENGSLEPERASQHTGSHQELSLDVQTFDNAAYETDMIREYPNAITRSKFSTSQPSIQPPRSHRTNENLSNTNRSLPILLLRGDEHSEKRRNERILQDLQGADFIGSHSNDVDLEAHFRRSAERLMEIPIPSKLGTATPPFESGFESTCSDIDSEERDRASVTDIVDGSSQLEMYDLEVASIGFSEMSWQNDNNSSSSRDIRREFIDKRLDRLRHLMPQFNGPDYGSIPSDRHGRTDHVSDRLSDLVEQDSSSDSDGSFTGSEYEYGDERISTNKLNRKHLVFSRHPHTSDSEVEGSFVHRKHSSDSSITNMTDVGSIQPLPNKKDSPRFAVPPIDWDQLLNWAMKYENLSDVYRDLAALGKNEERRSPLVSSARSSGRGKRDQKLIQKPVKFHSAQELHQSEEYV